MTIIRPPELQLEGATIVSRFGPGLCYSSRGKVLKVLGPFDDGTWTLVIETRPGQRGWINGVTVVNDRLVANGCEPIEVVNQGHGQLRFV